MNRGKIHEQHLERRAYVYIRQSSLRQVAENLESQDLQYKLVNQALEMGWNRHQIEVIDDDLGKSGASSQERAGFQSLVAAVGLRQVGIVLVTDVSRLARNCADWYQLLNLASYFDTLISDSSGIYNPQQMNDRMLLGMKGTFAEVQWFQMREQLGAARLNKAKRGELQISLPIGYEWHASGRVVKTPDKEVCSRIDLIFQQFRRLGSGRAVLNYLRENDFKIPHIIRTGPDKGQLYWKRPTIGSVYQFLKSPAYTGAYTYGKTRHVRLPGDSSHTRLERKPQAEWTVLIQDAFEGYICWEEYMQNQEKLAQNSRSNFQSLGAPLKGDALLQGLVLCARCGRRMHMAYNRHPAYVCRAAHNQYGDPLCQHFTAPMVDNAVCQLFLQAVTPARLEAALAAVAEIEQERQRLSQQWRLRLESARYQVALARRRYAQVDPDNRLVASALEQDWEYQLQALASLEKDWQKAQADLATPLEAAEIAQIQALAADLPALWQAETTTNTDRKRLLRCLIQDVTLDAFTDPKITQVFVRWHTGLVTHLQVPRPQPGRRASQTLLERVSALALTFSDLQIADRLNAEGLTTPTGLAWTAGRVFGLRRKNQIPSQFHSHSPQLAPRADGRYTIQQVAKFLQYSPTTIHDWFLNGFLVGLQSGPLAHVWLRFDAADRRRLDTSIPFDPETMVPYSQAPAHFQLSASLLRQAFLDGQITPLRVMIFNRPRWVVLSGPIPEPHCPEAYHE
jgi:DNA invertase Pin-like site-specific DNA recombinase